MSSTRVQKESAAHAKGSDAARSTWESSAAEGGALGSNPSSPGPKFPMRRKVLATAPSLALNSTMEPSIIASARRAPPSVDAVAEIGNGVVQSPAGGVGFGGFGSPSAPSLPSPSVAASSSGSGSSPRSVGTSASFEGMFLAPVSWNIASRLVFRHETNAAFASSPEHRK